MRRALRAPLAALLLAAVALPAWTGAPADVEAVGPVPECRLDDIMTVPHDYDSWSTTLVDWLLKVSRRYEPPDLVPVSDAGIAGPGVIRAVAIDDLRAMARAAARNGTPIAVNSPYRSYADQVASFNGWVNVDGYDDAITYSQRPGHSEHQLGLTIDFMTLGGGSALQGDWATDPSGAWMAENAWKYGWLMSYPQGEGGRASRTPPASTTNRGTTATWVARWREGAPVRMTIREYLWQHHTMVDPVTGEPLATPTPSAFAEPHADRRPALRPLPQHRHPGDGYSLGGVRTSTGGLPGVDQPVVVSGLLVVLLASVGFVAWRGFVRR